MKRTAFTLVELLVVVAIIGLLSTVAAVSLNTTRVNARNAQRKANLIQISKALELYYSVNNGYPSTSGVWQGNCSVYLGLPDSGAGAWIPNFTAYMAQLPHDPNTGKVNPSSAAAGCRTNPNVSCYVYVSNGTDYKVVAECLPEGALSTTDPFYDPMRPSDGWQVSSVGGLNTF